MLSAEQQAEWGRLQQEAGAKTAQVILELYSRSKKSECLEQHGYQFLPGNGGRVGPLAGGGWGQDCPGDRWVLFKFKKYQNVWSNMGTSFYLAMEAEWGRLQQEAGAKSAQVKPGFKKLCMALVFA